MYAFEHEGTVTSFDELGPARHEAENLTQELGIEIQVTHQETGAVAYVTTPVPQGQYFAPWQRIENPKFAAPYFAGFVPAYSRKRIEATVYRALDHSGWRIHDGRTNNFQDVANTKAACALTSSMRQGVLL